MTQNPAPQWFRRWSVISVVVVALVSIAAAAVYAGVRIAGDSEPEAQLIQPSSAPPSNPPDVRTRTDPPSTLPSAAPAADSPLAICYEVQMILWDMVGVDADYVETRRTAADRIRRLSAPTAALQAELDTFADELDAAAQMVEDDPGAEDEAFDREDAASSALIDSGECF